MFVRTLNSLSVIAMAAQLHAATIEVTDASIDGSVRWTADNTYLLSGLVFVEDGETLTIEPGTVIKGKPGERHRIWPIVQLSDWGEQVSADQVRSVMDHGTRPPATGVMVFNWGSLKKQADKVEAMAEFYRSIQP